MSRRIITVSREFGSGGRTIAKLVADKLGYEYYDKDLIEKINTKTHCGDRARQRVSNCCGKAISPAVADFSFTKSQAHSLTFESSHSHKSKLPSRGDHSEDYGINRERERSIHHT